MLIALSFIRFGSYSRHKISNFIQKFSKKLDDFVRNFQRKPKKLSQVHHVQILFLCNSNTQTTFGNFLACLKAFWKWLEVVVIPMSTLCLTYALVWIIHSPFPDDNWANHLPLIRLDVLLSVVENNLKPG